MTRARATELGPGAINANALRLGFLPTAMNRGFWAHRRSIYTTKE